MHLKNDRSAGIGAYMQKGTTSSVTVASRPEISFDQMAAPVPEIINGSLIVFCYEHNTEETRYY
jgi:hypothetical protein